MNGAEKILHAIGGIDVRFVEEAERYTKNAAIRKRAIAVTGAAAGVALVALGTVLLYNRLQPAFQTPISESSSCTSEIAVIPKWDEMSTAEKFGEVEFGGERYNGRFAAEYERGEYLGTAELNGYDVYEEKSYTANAEVYTNVGISTECAVVVVFDTGEEYVYTNTWYKPATLGDFVGDLNLRENLEITSALVQENRADGRSDTRYADVSTEKITEILFADESIANAEDFDQMIFEFGRSRIKFGIDVKKVGEKNISIGLTEDGWLITNILATGKAFYVGTEKIDEVMSYLETCEGETQNYEYYIEESKPDSYVSGEVSSAVSPAYIPE